MSDLSADGWRRFHPLSPLLRGGVAMLAVLGYVVSQAVDSLADAVTAGASQQPADGPPAPLWALALSVVLVVVGIALFAWLSWRFARFRVGADTVELRRGLVFREHRQLRHDRIQTVDISRSLIARVTGLAEVKVDSAGGAGSDVRLAYLTLAEARDVRAQLMRLAAQEPVDTPHPDQLPLPGVTQRAGGQRAAGQWGAGQHAGEQPDEHGVSLIQVPNARVLAATFLGPALWLVGLAVPVLVLGVVTGRWAWVLPLLVPLLLGGVPAQVTRAFGWFNFSVERLPGALRMRRGLMDLVTTTVPRRRVQAIRIQQPLLWRPFGWWRVQVNVAGATLMGQKGHEDLLLSVGTLAEAVAVVREIDPLVDPALLVAGLTSPQSAPQYEGAPRRARWLDPMAWRRMGVAVTGESLVIRAGRLSRYVDLVPHARVQSLTLRQGPLQRRLGVATVVVVSTVGPVRPRVAHLPTERAERVLAEQRRRSSQARRRRV